LCKGIESEGEDEEIAKVCPAPRTARKTEDRIDVPKRGLDCNRELEANGLMYRVHGRREAHSNISIQAGVQR